MIDYGKTKIYKIFSHFGDKINIGYTTKDYLSQRMSKHRYEYTYWKSNPSRTHITSYDLFEEYGIDNCLIELLEAKQCTSRDEQRKLEGKYIRELQCVNKTIPGRSNEEYKIGYNKKYYEANKDRLNDKHKKYNEANKDKIREHKKQIQILRPKTISN